MTMATLDHYRILGVSPRATWEEIQRRYRALAWQYHPDHHPDDPEAAAQFRQLAEAYDALRQAKTRPRASGPELPCGPGSATRDRYLRKSSASSGPAPLCSNPRAPISVMICRYPFWRPCGAWKPRSRCPAPRAAGTAARPAWPRGASYQDCPDCQGRGRRGGPGLLRFGPPCDRCRDTAKSRPGLRPLPRSGASVGEPPLPSAHPPGHRRRRPAAHRRGGRRGLPERPPRKPGGGHPRGAPPLFYSGGKRYPLPVQGFFCPGRPGGRGARPHPGRLPDFGTCPGAPRPGGSSASPAPGLPGDPTSRRATR